MIASYLLSRTLVPTMFMYLMPAEEQARHAEASGQAARFNQVYQSYKAAPDVTRQRMYLETLENIFGGMDKVIIDEKGSGQGVVPYLPLDQLLKRNPSAGAAP